MKKLILILTIAAVSIGCSSTYDECIDENNLDSCNLYLYDTSYSDQELSQMSIEKIKDITIDRKAILNKKKQITEARDSVKAEYNSVK